jgi:hypothetical protein
MYKSYFILKKTFNLLYFKYLINSSNFIIFFNYNTLLNKDLYKIKHEIYKRDLKSLIINSQYIENLFEDKFKFFASNIFFVFCNNINDFSFLLNMLNNFKIFYLFNKKFCNKLSKFDNILCDNINLLHFIIFRLSYNILLLILCYIINFINNIKNSNLN